MSRFEWLETAQPALGEQPAPAGEAPAGRYLREAEAAATNGRLEYALQLFGRALAENRGEVRAWLGQVVALVDLGKPDEAIVWSDQALAAFPDHADLLAAKALAFAAAGDSRRAKGFIDAAFEKAATPWTWCVRGALFTAVSPEVAETCFVRARAEGADASLLHRAGRAFAAAGDQGRALAFCLQAREAAPRNAWIWRSLARIHAELGETGKAETAAAQAERLDPHHALKDTVIRPGVVRRILNALGVKC